MRALLIFLLCAVPATAVLAWLDREVKRADALPDEAPRADSPAVLLGADLADPYGQTPFSGAVRRLDGFEMRVIDEGYFKLYLRVERLGRHEGSPRLEEVSAVVFDPPKEGKPNRRLRLWAPYVVGDAKELLHAPGSEPRIVVLGGGVKVFDSAGHQIAEVMSLSLDTASKKVAADVPVVLRLPERGAEVRARGLEADIGLKTVRLRGPVSASLSDGRGTITLRAKGDATVEETAEGAQILVAVEGDVEIEHSMGRAACPRLAAVFARADGKTSFHAATLSGGVRLELAPDAARGIDSVEMPSVVIEGQDRIRCAGPVRATWRGELPRAVALGNRTVRIDAEAASFRLGRAEDGAALLDEARFDGFRAEDADGAGSLAGKTLAYLRAGNRLEIEGAVDARAASGSVAADRLRVEAPEAGAYDVVLEGKKQVLYREPAGLGTLGSSAGTELRLVAEGPLRLKSRGEGTTCEAEREVVATTDAGARLRADRIRIAMAKGALSSFAAAGAVAVLEPSRGAEIRGDSLDYDGKSATVRGKPASIAMKDGRSVRAEAIAWREDNSFAAAGAVEVETTLASGARWRLACADLGGAIAADGTPSRVEAKGAVRATGPEGEEILGDSLDYDGVKGVATLLGAPARARRGEEVALVAPEGLSLRVEEGRLVEGRSLGPSTIDWRPTGQKGENAPKGFTRWVAELRGPARFERDRLVVEKGAKLAGYDGDRASILADAKRVEILLEADGESLRAKRIAGSGGVRVEGRGKSPAVVTADRLSYEAGSREVRVAGDATVVAEGWPRDVRFRELLFALTKDGIDLKSASDVEVR